MRICSETHCCHVVFEVFRTINPTLSVRALRTVVLAEYLYCRAEPRRKTRCDISCIGNIKTCHHIVGTRGWQLGYHVSIQGGSKSVVGIVSDAVGVVNQL